MFVSAGAKEAILSRRKNEFYDNYVKKLLEEAASIGLGKEEVIQLIQSGNEADGAVRMENSDTGSMESCR